MKLNLHFSFWRFFVPKRQCLCEILIEKFKKNRPKNQGFPGSTIVICKIVDFGFEMNTRELFVIENRSKEVGQSHLEKLEVQ